MAEMEIISTTQSKKRGRERERGKKTKQLCYREPWNQRSVKIWPREITWQMYSLQAGWQKVQHMAHFQQLCQVGWLLNKGGNMFKSSELCLSWYMLLLFLISPLIYVHLSYGQVHLSISIFLKRTFSLLHLHFWLQHGIYKSSALP